MKKLFVLLAAICLISGCNKTEIDMNDTIMEDNGIFNYLTEQTNKLCKGYISDGAEKLYITSYVTPLKELYDEAYIHYSSKSEQGVTDEADTLLDANIDSRDAILKEETEYQLVYDEIKNSLLAEIPNYDETSEDSFIATIANIESDSDLITYVLENAHYTLHVDYGDEDIDSELYMELLLNDCAMSIEDYKDLDFEDKKSFILQFMLGNQEKYNNDLSERYEDTISDENIKRLVDIKLNRDYYRKQLNDELGIIDPYFEYDKKKETDVVDYVEYNTHNDSIDYDEFIKIVDMENPAFSDSIKQDDNGEYYILWTDIYDLADQYNQEKMADNLQFIAYGQEITIPMPEVPLSFYGRKGQKPELKSWRLVTDSSGSQWVEATFGLPELKEDKTFHFYFNQDGELYESNEFQDFIKSRE